MRAINDFRYLCPAENNIDCCMDFGVTSLTKITGDGTPSCEFQTANTDELWFSFALPIGAFP